VGEGAVAVESVGKLNGVASLLQRVIEEKLEEGPHKRRVFDRLTLTVFVHVVDSGQSATVEFRSEGGRGSARVGSGRLGRPDLRVECDQNTFVQFTMFTLTAGRLPNFFDDNGKAAAQKLVKRQLVIRGLLLHAAGLVQFIRFLAIEDDE
jgi:hypothetical protein